MLWRCWTQYLNYAWHVVIDAVRGQPTGQYLDLVDAATARSLVAEAVRIEADPDGPDGTIGVVVAAAERGLRA